MQFDAGSPESAIDEILHQVRQPFRYVVTPNVHHIVKMHDEGEWLKTAYGRAWKVFCDSRVLSALARTCGIRLAVVTGSDLTAALVARASDARLKLAIVGPSESDCGLLKCRFPSLDIVSHSPPMGFISSETEIRKCIDFVLASCADLTFLAVGMPQQEILAVRLVDHRDATGVGLCIGASIDFLTGKQQRAPRWMQRLGLEWLHRLASNPKRLAKRYLIECPRIFPLIIAYAMNSKSRS